ncbi:MAG: potassium-transporting ATPase subunit F [Clostridia bacterium]|uniref:Potassium-transporting ATPase subunit F n=1 Tax=Bianquea renquensis TaxID=2763661 RepID=A0A926DS00_9FIRM|nr:potassium-transporting ATPase subunit F [Bianquea renquensis]MBC8544178.1 potassium-transporting ATPase subunit F [Bianquea renquensis]
MEVVTGIVGVVALLVLVYLGYVLLKGEDRR